MASQVKGGYVPPRRAAHVTQEEIQQGLGCAGLRPGDTVLVHSSLSRFGYVEGGADAVIDALLETVGTEGTLLMSAITTTEQLVARCIEAADEGVALDGPPLDVAHTKTWAGAIPETFRKRPGVKHSLHPTHAVTAVGPRAEEMLANHYTAPGPCGEGTPFMRLADLDRGFILLLGINHESNTALHGVEELAQVEYVLYPKWCRVPILTSQGLVEARTRVHISYMNRRLGALETQYLDSRAETVTHIGDAVVRLIHCATMRDITLSALKEDPFLLLSAKGREAWRIMQETGVYTHNPLRPDPA